jgi:hypothetical protein
MPPSPSNPQIDKPTNHKPNESEKMREQKREWKKESEKERQKKKKNHSNEPNLSV